MDPNLSEEQNRSLEYILRWLRQKIQHNFDPYHYPAPDQLKLLIHGGPGVGKSYLSNVICKKTAEALIGTPTGMAATQIEGARTLHSLLSIPAMTRSDLYLSYRLQNWLSFKIVTETRS